jgi:hypothetical protein
MVIAFAAHFAFHRPQFSSFSSGILPKIKLLRLLRDSRSLDL